MIFSIFRKEAHRQGSSGPGPLTGVTFWNITDRHTWLDDYPVPGRKNYPLLFDTNGQPKKAFRDVVDF